AQVVVLVLDRHLDPAVLGATLLGNVDRRHDLDAREDRGQEAAGRAVAFDQDAVNSVPDPDAVSEWLDVDVAGPQADGSLDDQVNEFDDRGGASFEALARGGIRRGEVDGGVGELLQHRVHGFRFRLAVVPVDGLDDLLAAGEHGLYIFVQDE